MKKVTPYIIAAIFLILFLHQCSKTSELKDNSSNASKFLNDTITYFKNKLGQEVAEKTSLKGDKKQLQILLSNQIDSTGQLKELIKDFKNTSAAGNINQQTRIDTIRIPYDSIVDFEFIRNWSKKDKFYSLTGTSNQFGIIIDSLTVPNTISFAIGEKSSGFFKTETKVNVVNSNPYVKTTGIDTYTYSEQKKRLGLGLSAGYGIGGVYIGIGINFNLVNF
jgi:hypothetical protein